MFNSVKKDERSDNEEEDEDLSVGDVVGNATAAARDVVEAAKQEVTKRMEESMESQTTPDGPAVLLNGKPVGGVADPKEVIGRRRKR